MAAWDSDLGTSKTAHSVNQPDEVIVMGFWSYLGNEAVYQSRKLVSPATWAGTAKAIDQRHQQVQERLAEIKQQEQEIKVQREAEHLAAVEAKYQSKIEQLEAKLAKIAGE